MDVIPRRDYLTGAVANETVSEEEGFIENWMPPREKASDYTNNDQQEERKVVASFDTLKPTEATDAMSKSRHSSPSLALSISKVALAPGPRAQAHSVPRASTEHSQSQLTPRFDPLVTTISPYVKKTPQMSKPVQSPSPPVKPASPPQPHAAPTSDTTSTSPPLLPKQRLISILTRLTQGTPRAFAEVNEVMRLLRLEYPWAKDEFLLSMIKEAEEENVVVREKDEEGGGWAGLGGPQARPSDKPTPSSKPQTVHPDPSRHGVPKPVASTPSSEGPTTTSSAPESISPAQLRTKFTPLIHTIKVLGGSRSRANYESIKYAMRNRYKEMRSFGWTSFGEMVEAAYKAHVVEAIRKKPNGKIASLKLLPAPPPPPPRSVPSTIAADYPPEHLPVVQTMLGLMGGDMDAAVGMVVLATALGRRYPRKEGEYSLIAKAEAAGVLRQGEGAYGGTWAYLNRPLAPAISQPLPLPGGSNVPAKSPAKWPAPHPNPPRQSITSKRKGAKKARRVPLKAAAP